MSESFAALTNRVPGFVEDLALLRVPPWWQSPWILAALLILLIGLGVAGARFYRRALRSLEARQRAAAGPAPGEPPETWALRRLDEIRAKAPQCGHYRLAIECSWVLRLYLEARFKLPIIFQTTREFLEHARTGEALGVDHRESLGRYLQDCDRVKFGRRGLTEAELEALFEDAIRFVKLGGSSPAAAPSSPAPAVREIPFPA